MYATGRRPWPVRLLINVGTGLIVIILALLVMTAAYSLFWGLMLGPLWLQWSIGGTTALVVLALIGATVNRKEP